MAMSGSKVVDFELSSFQAALARFVLVKYGNGGEKKSVPQAASTFMSIVPEDLLLEIFLRLPNGRRVIQCANVCKRWYSLIINPYTRTRFVEYQLRKHPPTILFNYNAGPHYQLSSKAITPKQFDLNSDDLNLKIRASSGYFLLLNRGANQYYICNTLTGHWLVLPEAPSLNKIWGFYSYALICDPPDDVKEHPYSYRVVLVYNLQFYRNKYHGQTVMFDSETGLWTKKHFSMRYKTTRRGLRGFDGTYMNGDSILNHYIAVPSNGVLYWLQGMESLVVCDPLRNEFSHVQLPADEKFIHPEYGKWEVRLGVVQDRVRLSLLHEAAGNCGFSLKVWEFDSCCLSWLLVHDVVLKEISSRGDAICFVLAFDPFDGNVLFLVRGDKIYSYEIDQDKYKEICDFPSTFGPTLLKDNVGWRVGVLILVPPLWQTPAIPSTNQT